MLIEHHDELTSTIHKCRGSIAADKSHGKPDDDPALIDKRRDLAALKLERAVCLALAAAPKPTDAQCQRIAALLLAGGTA